MSPGFFSRTVYSFELLKGPKHYLPQLRIVSDMDTHMSYLLFFAYMKDLVLKAGFKELQ